MDKEEPNPITLPENYCHKGHYEPSNIWLPKCLIDAVEEYGTTEEINKDTWIPPRANTKEKRK